jgi:hypothetical protein
MRSKRTFGASGYAEAQESGVEPAHSNRTCSNRTCSNRTCSNRTCSNRTCSNRTRSNRARIVGTSRHAHNRRNEEQPIGRDAKALIGAFR